MTNPYEFQQMKLSLQSLARSFRRARVHDMSDRHLSVLLRLETGDASPGELADLEGVTPPSMNDTLNQLSEAGLVARRRDRDDARRVRVRLTSSGRACTNRARASDSAWFAERVIGDERRILSAAISVLNQIAER